MKNLFSLSIPVRVKKLVSLTLLTSVWVSLVASVAVGQKAGDFTPPPAPTTPPPPGQRKPGGSLSGDRPSCLSAEPPLTALVPENAHGTTTLSSPTFWFYVPYRPDEIREGRFSLMSADESQRYYQTKFALPQSSGWMSLQLPQQDNLLVPNQPYHWYFSLYCTGNETTRPDVVVHGWITRLPHAENSISLTGNHESKGFDPTELSTLIWYDTAHQLASSRQLSNQASGEWEQLLQSVGLESLVQIPIIGPFLPR